jgi:hypothetical protein
VVAWFALVVSSLALSWQFYYTVRIDRAAIAVNAAYQTWRVGAGSEHLYLVITVTNVGRRATVVQGVFLISGKRTKRIREYLPKRWRSKRSPTLFMAPTTLPDRSQAAMPCRLDVGDEVSMYFDRGTVRFAVEEEDPPRLHAYATASTARAGFSRTVRAMHSPPK